MTSRRTSERDEGHAELLIIEVSPKKEDIQPSQSSINLWNKLVSRLHNFLLGVSKDVETEIRSKLQKQTVENEQIRQEIKNL